MYICVYTCTYIYTYIDTHPLHIRHTSADTICRASTPQKNNYTSEKRLLKETYIYKRDVCKRSMWCVCAYYHSDQAHRHRHYMPRAHPKKIPYQTYKRDQHIRKVKYERDVWGVYAHNTIHIRRKGPHTTCREHISKRHHTHSKKNWKKRPTCTKSDL